MIEFDQLMDSFDPSSPRPRELGRSISEKISQMFSDEVLFLNIDGDEENDLVGCDIQAFQLIEVGFFCLLKYPKSNCYI